MCMLSIYIKNLKINKKQQQQNKQENKLIIILWNWSTFNDLLEKLEPLKTILLESYQLSEVFFHGFLCTLCAQKTPSHLVFYIRINQACTRGMSREKRVCAVLIWQKKVSNFSEAGDSLSNIPLWVTGHSWGDVKINIAGVMMQDFIFLIWRSIHLYLSSSANGNCFCECRFLLKHLCDENLSLHTEVAICLIQSWTQNLSSSSS